MGNEESSIKKDRGSGREENGRRPIKEGYLREEDDESSMGAFCRREA